jgi:hypothetical protein
MPAQLARHRTLYRIRYGCFIAGTACATYARASVRPYAHRRGKPAGGMDKQINNKLKKETLLIKMKYLLSIENFARKLSIHHPNLGIAKCLQI